MTGILIAAASTAFILILGEYLWRKRILKGEFARKFVHISAATLAAFWPYYISRPSIALLSLIFVAALVAIKQLRLFKSVHSVQRATYGEIWYALSIGLMALLFQDNLIYTIAVLHMSLADGLAAVVGVGLNHKAKQFKFMGSKKSVAGTLTFVLISFLLNMTYWTIASHGSILIESISPVVYSAMSAVVLAFTELASPKGSDNVIVPFVAGIIIWIPTIVLTAM